MSLWQRLRRLFDAKAHAALDRAEDPVSSMELAYRTQVSALEEARRGVADVLTSEKRLEIEVHGLSLPASGRRPPRLKPSGSAMTRRHGVLWNEKRFSQPNARG